MIYHATGSIVHALHASRKENSGVKAWLSHSPCFLLGELGSWPCEQRSYQFSALREEEQ